MMCRLSNFDARMLLVCSPPQTSLLKLLDELLLLDELDELCEDELERSCFYVHDVWAQCQGRCKPVPFLPQHSTGYGDLCTRALQISPVKSLHRLDLAWRMVAGEAQEAGLEGASAAAQRNGGGVDAGDVEMSVIPLGDDRDSANMKGRGMDGNSDGDGIHMADMSGDGVGQATVGLRVQRPEQGDTEGMSKCPEGASTGVKNFFSDASYYDEKSDNQVIFQPLAHAVHWLPPALHPRVCT